MNRKYSHTIIGGMFGLELFSLDNISYRKWEMPFHTDSKLLLSTARSIFSVLARTLRPKTVWLPSFLCQSIRDSFASDMTHIRYFGINEQLKIEEKSWLSEILENDIVVFIDYFGFDDWSEWGAEARQRGAWIVEDACQAMLNNKFSEHSHYIVFSPRKFVGVPDGGILLAQNGAKLPMENGIDLPAEWWLSALKASILRAEYDRYSGEKHWFELFQKTEAQAPLIPCRMSDLSLMILKSAVDWHKVSQRRRDNYKFLASELEGFAIFPNLNENVVPLGFPISLKNRDHIRQALFAEKIYPPVHWPIAGVVPVEFEASHRLAAEIMTIPCDQRYGQSDMERIVCKLKQEIFR